MPELFGQKIRARRQHLGWTQAELATHTGLSQRSIRNIELGAVAPHAASVRRLTAALGMDGTPRFQINILGHLQLLGAAGEIRLTSPMLHSLLCLFALQGNQKVGRGEIVDTLWADHPPPSVINLVHTYITRLRRLFDAERRSTTATPTLDVLSGGYMLTVAPECIDAGRSAAATDVACRHQARGDHAAAAAAYADALDAWRGPVLADAPSALRSHPAAVALSERRLTVALRYADAAHAAGDCGAAISRLRSVIADEPLHEALIAKLMIALACSGRRANALTLFESIRTELAENLGVRPGQELQSAHMHVLGA
ncbi:BTAD domain-containing putative transcriptional regulator [Pseudonocardia sp. TRM90224]|uniref:BTAD domain-containing putative transcriptional regulator n=1 Tax=Pseudonocardia sp. TRM90224 TaxID=2812678 RepID=UPI001E403692|nr:BTAD domain-containing putative transcriptional regulator [Pseudonocardia sp. TRM90224]